MIRKVLKIFKVNSINRLIIIFIVFAITGSLSVILGEYVLLLFFSDDVVKGFFLLGYKNINYFSTLSNFINNYWECFWRV